MMQADLKFGRLNMMEYDGTTCYPQFMDFFDDEVASEAISGDMSVLFEIVTSRVKGEQRATCTEVS